MIYHSPIKDHQNHLNKREERFNRSTPEPNILFGEIAIAREHLVDKGKNGKVCYGFCQGSVAEDQDLLVGHRLG